MMGKRVLSKDNKWVCEVIILLCVNVIVIRFMHLHNYKYVSKMFALDSVLWRWYLIQIRVCTCEET